MLTFKKHTKTNYEGLAGFVLFFISAFCILGCSSAASKGALNGLKIASSVIIPALFPFTVCSVFFQKSGGLLWISGKLNRVTNLFFNLTGTEFSVILISLLGGYPIGAKITDELFLSGLIEKSVAQRLLRFCVNPSPAFFISVVGMNIFNSFEVGVILFVSNTISCIILNCIFTRKKNIKDLPEYSTAEKSAISDAFVKSVYCAAEITINISAWIVLFSAIAGIIKNAFSSYGLYSLICPFLEISFGINEINKIALPTHFYSFLLSFGGVSTLCQVKQSASSLNPSFLYILFHRIIHGVTATLISALIFKIFPQTNTVFSNNVQIKSVKFAMFLPSVMLIIFSVLFLFVLSSPKAQNN